MKRRDRGKLDYIQAAIDSLSLALDHPSGKSLTRDELLIAISSARQFLDVAASIITSAIVEDVTRRANETAFNRSAGLVEDDVEEDSPTRAAWASPRARPRT